MRCLRCRTVPAAVVARKFGINEGIWNLINLLETVQLPATFFVPGEVAKENGVILKDVSRRGFEIAAHGYTHTNPQKLSADEQSLHLQKTCSLLEDITGKRTMGYRAPGYNIGANTLEIIARQGLLYDSSLMDSENLYIMENGLVEIPVSWPLDDWTLYGESTECEMANITPSFQIREVLQYELEARLEAGVLFVTVLHPQLSGRIVRIRAWKKFLIRYADDPRISWTSMQDMAKDFAKENISSSTSNILST